VIKVTLVKKSKPSQLSQNSASKSDDASIAQYNTADGENVSQTQQANVPSIDDMPNGILEEQKKDQDAEPSDVSAEHCSAPLQNLWKTICNNKKSLAGTAAAGLVGAGAYLCNQASKRQQRSNASKYLKAAGAIVGLGALGATAYYRNKKEPTASSEDSSSISRASSEAPPPPRTNRRGKPTKRSKSSKKNDKSSNTMLICGVIFIILVVAYYAMM